MQIFFKNYFPLMNNYEEIIRRITQKIKALRTAKGLSIQELAYRCDMERSNLSRLEAGRTNMTIKTLTIICNALEIDIRELLR